MLDDKELWRLSRPTKQGQLVLLSNRVDSAFILTYFPPTLTGPGKWKLDIWDHGEHVSENEHSDPQELIKLAEAFKPFKREF